MYILVYYKSCLDLESLIHDLNCSVTYIFCAMRIYKNAVHWEIDGFVKFESAVNLEIRGQNKKNGFLLFGSQGPYVCSFIEIWVGAV